MTHHEHARGPEFVPFPKLARLNRDVVITEKIDGTNAAIIVGDDGQVWAQSRKRIVTPGKSTDNYGFAAWVSARQDRLRDLLGPGHHFGEYWGQGIQRGYDLGEKRFSLFNATRWTDVVGYDFESGQDIGLHVVPLLWAGAFSTNVINGTLNNLKVSGSLAAPGWSRPEGIVVWHTAANLGFKVTVENDEKPKGQVEAERVA